MSLEKINKTAYKVFSSMPEDEAKVLMSAIVYDTLPTYIEENSPYIHKQVNAWLSKRFDAYERYLKRQYIERIKKNQDVSDLEETYEVLSKANFDNRTYDWTPERERLHPRDPKGRFRDSPYKIHKPVGPMKPIKNPEAAGIPDFKKEGAKNLRPERVAELQNAYLQVLNTLKAHDQKGMGDQKWSIRGTNGTKVYEGINEENVKDVFIEYAKTGNKPIEFKVITPQSSVGGVYFDALSSVPGVNQNAALGIYSGGRDLPSSIAEGSEFQQGWFSDAYARSDNEPRFRRLKTGADLVDSFVPESAIKTKAALAGARYVGELGPDAEKIIGPAARKISYRSRGTEKKSIDPALLAAALPDNKWAGKKDERSGKIVQERGFDRTRAILGYSQPVMRDGKVKQGGAPGLIPQYFIERLPNKDYWELQRKSGAVPPSEGVVIDSTGKIVSQSVGFKDDHYLPFNLKALAKLRGGEYVRTRSTGGPTTEDVYTALVSGATSFTVASRSGVFTVDFDPSFTGRRRYNDKAGKMVERYGKLLDAAGSGEVTLKDVDEERYAEIVEQARENTTNQSDYRAYLSKLLDEEKFKPKPSRQMREDVFTKAQTQVLEETINGTGPFAARYNEFKGNGAPMENLRAMVNQEAQERTNAMLRKELKDRSFKAMRLDGEGYLASLEALREQYPYYIKEIHYHRLNAGEKDKGYVKPKFLRPDEVWEGYFDQDIKGKAPNTGITNQMVSERHQKGEHGKVRASATNYQNYKVGDAKAAVAEDAEEKATSSTPTGSTSSSKTPAAVDARERQAQQLAAAYTGYLQTKVVQDGEEVPVLSDELKEFGIDPLNPLSGIRSKMRSESDFGDRLYQALRSHEQTIAGYIAGAGGAVPDPFNKWRSALNEFDRDKAPKVELPKEAPIGLIALDNPDKILNFPEIDDYTDLDIKEALKRPDVVSAAQSLNALPGSSMTEKATDRLRELGDQMLKAARDAQSKNIKSSPEMEKIESEAAALARLKALLVRREQLGSSVPYQSTSINESGDIVARILGQ